jgi:low temperature requirement protein LtrA
MEDQQPSSPGPEDSQGSDAAATADTAAAEALDADSLARQTVTWLELFFDLVVVAAFVVLTEGVREEPDLAGVSIFLLLYAAIWLSWVTVVMYANVAAERTRTTTVIIAMFLFAMMAASAPNHFEQRANAFAVGFLLVRVLAARGSMSTGRLLTNWPLLQFGGIATPWIVAMWVHPPIKYWIWAGALVVDLVMVIVQGGSGAERRAAEMTARMDDAAKPRPSGRRGNDDGRQRDRRPVRFVTVEVDRDHLDERLGVFGIIVLGEAIMGLMLAAASTLWDRPFVVTVLTSFGLLVGLWWLTFCDGVAAAPHAQLAALPPRFALPLHLGTTAGIVCLAAGLGELALHAHEPPGTAMRWLTCAGVALYFLITGAAGWAGGAPLRWLLGWALPTVVVPLVLALVGTHIEAPVLTLLLLVVVLWQVAYSLAAREKATGKRVARRT